MTILRIDKIDHKVDEQLERAVSLIWHYILKIVNFMFKLEFFVSVKIYIFYSIYNKKKYFKYAILI